MSYFRVIPRDLFNEANLLKCYGRIFINLETCGAVDATLEHDGEAFDVVQDEDGCLSIANVDFIIRGERQVLYRPLNSRAPWPLYLRTPAEEEIAVFTDDGSFSAEMLAHLQAPTDAPAV